MWPFKNKQEKIEKKEEGPSKNASISFEFRDSDGLIFVKSSWPVFADHSSSSKIAKNLATMIYLMSTGDLLPTIRQSLVMEGKGSMDLRTADLTLIFLEDALRLKTATRPAIHPCSAFLPSGQGGPPINNVPTG